MDTLTHALSGALLARATAPEEQHQPGVPALTLRARMIAGFLAAAFPDSDFVLRVFDTLTYVTLHRGVRIRFCCSPHGPGLLPGFLRCSRVFHPGVGRGRRSTLWRRWES